MASGSSAYGIGVRAPLKINRVQSSLQKGIVNMYLCLQEEGKGDNVPPSREQLVQRIAKLLNLSVSTIKNVLTKWTTGEQLQTPGKTRKRKSLVTCVDSFSREAIANKIFNRLLQGSSVTISKLHEEIVNDETIEFEGSQTSLRRIVKEMGFTWGKGDKYAHIRESEKILFLRTVFLRRYMGNKNAEFPLPVVFLDETWIYVNGEASKTWMKKDTVKGHQRRPDPGSRLVIVHAGGRQGFIPGAALIFNSSLKTGEDYHGAMNAENFQRWVRCQLVPGLATPSLVVMDNAAYHSKVLDPEPTTKWTKPQLITWLQQRGSVVTGRENKSELQLICNMYRSSMKRYVVDEILQEKGHRVLRLPPYHCIFNPIEQVWAELRNSSVVASRPGQGLERAKAVWEESLNQVTLEKWNSYVDHAERIIYEYWSREVEDVPEVEEFEITLGASEDDMEDEEEEEPLATPLE